MVISGAGVISTNGQFTSNGNILVTSTGNLVVANTAASTSTATGALVITGGAGIAGNVAIGGNINLTTAGVLGGGGNILVNGVAGAIGQVLTQTGAGVAWQSGGASNYVFSAGGGSNVIVTASNVNVSINTSNIASFGSSGLQIITATASTSTITGALQVAGGVGIAGNLNVGTVGTTSGVFHTVIGNITQSTSGGAVYINTSGNILATGGVFQTINAANITITGVTPSGSGGGLYVSTSANVIVNNAAPSTSTTTGAVVIVGGVGIAGNLQLQGNLFVYPGGNVRIANTSQATSSTSGALQVVGGISSSSGNIYDNKGDVRASPISSQAGATIATAADAGRTIYIATGGVTINASVFNAGDMVTIVNNSSSAQTITAGTSVTFRLAGTASTGNRTLAQYGMCTFLCVVGGATPTFHCSGAGLT
jgi:hypothetical protein